MERGRSSRPWSPLRHGRRLKMRVLVVVDGEVVTGTGTASAPTAAAATVAPAPASAPSAASLAWLAWLLLVRLCSARRLLATLAFSWGVAKRENWEPLVSSCRWKVLPGLSLSAWAAEEAVSWCAPGPKTDTATAGSRCHPVACWCIS